LTDSVNPRDYWFKMKIRVKNDDGIELSTLCRQLKMKSSDGKLYLTDCANTESVFRIIQSIPSPKAEPFKRWLAKVGYERILEIEDPELALLLSMLGEASTTEITKTEHPSGFVENKKVSRRGGKIAGGAREKLEKEIGKSIVTSNNFLPKPRQTRKLK